MYNPAALIRGLTCRTDASNLCLHFASCNPFPPAEMSALPFQVLCSSKFAHAFIELIMTQCICKHQLRAEQLAKEEFI